MGFLGPVTMQSGPMGRMDFLVRKTMGSSIPEWMAHTGPGMTGMTTTIPTQTPTCAPDSMGNSEPGMMRSGSMVRMEFLGMKMT